MRRTGGTTTDTLLIDRVPTFGKILHEHGTPYTPVDLLRRIPTSDGREGRGGGSRFLSYQDPWYPPLPGLGVLRDIVTCPLEPRLGPREGCPRGYGSGPPSTSPTGGSFPDHGPTCSLPVLQCPQGSRRRSARTPNLPVLGHTDCATVPRTLLTSYGTIKNPTKVRGSQRRRIIHSNGCTIYIADRTLWMKS